MTTVLLDASTPSVLSQVASPALAVSGFGGYGGGSGGPCLFPPGPDDEDDDDDDNGCDGFTSCLATVLLMVIVAGAIACLVSFVTSSLL